MPITDDGRIEFSLPTKRIVSQRAGLQCSFPTCNRHTTGPGPTPDTVAGSGKAAHIYSAAPGGPRGQGGLTAEELEQPENCIWLCSDHATLVDNNRGVRFPAETLLSYKALHEARIEREVQGLYAPIGWVHRVTVANSPIFEPRQTITLAKLNLLSGENATGKTALIEWILGAFHSKHLRRWLRHRTRDLRWQVEYLNPEPVIVETQLPRDGGRVSALNGTRVPFNPIAVRVFRVQRFVEREEWDDLTALARALNVSRTTVRNLLGEVEAFPHAQVRNLRFQREDGRHMLYADVNGTAPGLPFRTLSGRETERIVLELATAAARVSGRYNPTVLVFDDGFPSIVFEGFFDFYSHHLLDPQNQFQTIMGIPTRNLDLNALRWKGWEVIRTIGTPPNVTLSQEIR